MHLVNDINLVFAYLGRDAYLLVERTYVLDRVVAGSVELVYGV